MYGKLQLLLFPQAKENFQEAYQHSSYNLQLDKALTLSKLFAFIQ